MNSLKHNHALRKAIEGERSNVQELITELIKIPNENLSGNNYLEICNLLEARLKAILFETHLIRAKGTLETQKASKIES